MSINDRIPDFLPDLDVLLKDLAAHAPAEGQPWDLDRVANVVASSILDQVNDRLNRKAEVLARIEARWAAVGAHRRAAPIYVYNLPEGYTPHAQRSLTEQAVAENAAHIEAQLQKNQAAFTAIASTLTALGTAALSGGITAPAVIQALQPLAAQITDLLNS